MMKNYTIKASAMLCFLFIHFTSFSITKTFVGTDTTDSDGWHIAANWIPSGVPTASDDIVFEGTNADYGNTNITVNNITVTSATTLSGNGTFIFKNLSIADFKSFTTNKDVVISQSSSDTCFIGTSTSFNIRHNKSGTSVSFGVVVLDDYGNITWAGARNASIHDLQLGDYNLVEFSSGSTYFGVAQNWDKTCSTAAFIRSRLSGNDAKLFFAGSGNTGHYNHYEDINVRTGVDLDVSNSKLRDCKGSMTGGSTVRNTVVSASSGFFNDGTSWIGGCPPSHLDSVVIKNGHVLNVPNKYHARSLHLEVEGTGKVEGDKLSYLEVGGNMRTNSDSCYSNYPGTILFRSLVDAVVLNSAGNTVKFGGPVEKDVNGTTLFLQDTVWFECQESGRGDVSILRGTIDCGNYHVYLQNLLNVTGNAFLESGTSTWIAKGAAGEITELRISGTGHLYNLVLDKENDVDYIECTTDVEVENSFTLNKGICNVLNSSTLILRNNAISGVGNSESYVDGPMQKIGNQAFTFPMGNRVGGSNYFAPIGISAPSASSDAFTAQYYYATPINRTSYDSTLDLVTDSEYWDLSRDVGSSAVNITLSYNTWSTITGYIGSLTQLKVAHYQASLTEWESNGLSANTGTMSSGTITSDPVNDFSPFTLGMKTLAFLPVDFIGVSATEKSTQYVEVKWEVASELDNKGFFVERYNAPSSTWESIGFVKGAGTSHTRSTYDLLDNKASLGVNTYRIKQVDFSGEISYSEQVNVYIENYALQTQAYPNPANNELYISNTVEKINSVTIVDLSGTMVISATLDDYTSKIDVSSLQSGMYVMHISTMTGMVTKRIVVSR